MSDEEESLSEGFSASEDEWKPSKDAKGGESSDDDDSDFDGPSLVGRASVGIGANTSKKRDGPKARSAAKQTSSKKRPGLSLRTKLYNKYRPPPKTFSPPNSVVGNNSPTSSTSCSNSKNAKAPNVSNTTKSRHDDGGDTGSSSESSIDDYLVNPEDIDIQSSFFSAQDKTIKTCSVPPAPDFDCNVGIETLSGSEEDDGAMKRNEKPFDFSNLLEYAKNLERVKESVAKHNAEELAKKSSTKMNIDTLDVYAVLALGEKQNRSHNDGEDEDDEDDEGLGSEKQHINKNLPLKLSKTKSTRIKRHTKTRPSSTVAANDTDDSDWEEVADSSQCIDSKATSSDISEIGNLEIHVELPSRSREKKTKSQLDIEMAFKRRLNREIKERQVLMHKASLLCHIGRILFYNRLLNNTVLMQTTLKLLPSKSAYPPDKGTEIKYFQSMVTWFKSAIKLKTKNLYPENSAAKTKTKAYEELLKQIENKEARSKQDMIFIFVILLRGMGLQCRLVVSVQPLPLKPAQTDLLKITMKRDDKSKDQNSSVFMKGGNKKESTPSSKTDTELKISSKAKAIKQVSLEMEIKKIAAEQSSKNQDSQIDEDNNSSNKNNTSIDFAKTSKRLKQVKEHEKDKTESTSSTNPDNSIEGGNESSVRTFKPTKRNAKKNKPNAEKTKHIVEKENDKNEQIIKNDYNTKTCIENMVLNKMAKTASKSSTVLKRTRNVHKEENNNPEKFHSSQKENKTEFLNKPSLGRLKRTNYKDKIESSEPEIRNKITMIEPGSLDVPTILLNSGKQGEEPSSSKSARGSYTRSKSPQAHISTAFLIQHTSKQEKFSGVIKRNTNVKKQNICSRGSSNKVKISTDFLKNTQIADDKKRVLRSRQKTNEPHADVSKAENLQIPQLDGANDGCVKCTNNNPANKNKLKAQYKKENSDEDFEPSPSKKPKIAPALPKRNRRVVSSDDENDILDAAENEKRKQTASDMWLEVWCDVEEQWVCVDIFKGKIHCVDTIRKSASPSMAYVFAFQNDLSIKDVTARYCPNWTTTVRKSRVEKGWLDTAISKYLGHRTKRDIKEDQELRRIHEEKPMPTAISDYKNHPFYALERHLLKFEALYPPNAPALGYIRGEPVYSRDCVHTLHCREIWLKQARTVKLGEKPYKIVKARPKWDRITQTVIKDQPLEIFGYWQTQDYEPPTAENGIVPRNAYGNVELFKPCMLPKKTKHIRLPGLNRICKKMDIDCANAVVGFDFHQGACHPTYDGFIVCEEFEDQVVAAWYQDQEEQERKEQEKYEARVYGNWKKLIRGLLIRERLKLKYNF